MSNYELMAIIITFVALLGYVNLKTFQLPTTIAIMGGTLLLSLMLLVIDYWSNNNWETYLQPLLLQIDFKEFLLNGILNLLLFAGAINIDLNHLIRCRYEISVLALGSTVLSTILIGYCVFYLAPFFGLSIPMLYCFLLGAVISPTDPIAVLAIFKELNAPDTLDVTVSGESLFNDGVAIVIFTTLMAIATGGTQASVTEVAELFFKLAVGGMIYGCLLGLLGYKLISHIHNEKVEILLTLSIATGGYYLAHAIGVSGPLAMVCAGIFIGNQGRNFAMTRHTAEVLDNFWEMVDELLNAILFCLIGAELLVLSFDKPGVYLGLALIPCFVVIRAITVVIPMSVFERFKRYPRFFKSIIVWGGLRGGLAVALALSLPNNEYREHLLIITYSMVVFSILIQGSTVKYLISRTSAE